MGLRVVDTRRKLCKNNGRNCSIPVSEAYLGRVVNAPLNLLMVETDVKQRIAKITILNQQGQNVICVYVAIGQKRLLWPVVTTLRKESDGIHYCGSQTADSPLHYNTLLLIREQPTGASLSPNVSSIQRSPDHEAYSGDVFYLHSRLLERVAKLSSSLGEGSMTALPIVETQSVDVSLIFLLIPLLMWYLRFRVGSAAQIKAMKQVAEAFAQFASDLDKATHNQFARGQRLRELLEQSQSAPLTVEEQIMTIYTETNSYLDSLEVGQVRKFLVELRTYLKTTKPHFQEIISSTKTFTESPWIFGDLGFQLIF
ncbi:hypothetical protein H5410_035126 [Solanum commersonii]|uniref:ATP synthase subunit alpha, mitochondrial n=1 Tax=Solanum commersonii TaxID=4109 RepID=A0A9J5Y459_SOLCO|nr:hypothetical protein H5410_035126 [Solanum commersonii]